MKYLKYFESVYEIENYIQDINDILLELYDEDWIIYINYTPKRFENPNVNYIIKSDYIGVTIKKKQNKRQSLYPDNSEFTFSEVSEYINRIIDYSTTDYYEIRICTLVGESRTYKGITGYSENTGIWSDFKSELPELDKEIVGIEIHIYLKGENIDDFKFYQGYSKFR
jgi:hypothetical protein